MTPIVLFLLLSIAWTWPLAARFAWRIPHDPGDPLLNTWILWWNARALPFSEAWWSPPIFYPMPGALALSEHLLGIALFTTPLQIAGLGPIEAYNLALVLCGWLSGYFAFLLGRQLTGSILGGVVAGIAFGIAPYRASQLSHLQVLTSQWMPLALFAMHAYLADGRRRWLALFAAAWLLQALSNGYYLLFFPLLVGLWLVWFTLGRTGWRRGAALAATFAASSLLLIPSLLRYKAVHDALGLQRTLGEMRMFSAKLTSFIQPAHLLTVWPTLPAETQEGFLFPGLTVIALSAAGVIALVRRGRLREAFRSRSAAMFYGVAAVVMAWLCFGPADTPTPAEIFAHPYTLLMWAPGFDGLRVPARFGMIVALCLSIAAAIAAARLLPPGAASMTRRGAGAAIIAILLLGGLFVDGWIDTMPMAAPPQRVMIGAAADAVLIELPADDPAINVAAMYRAMAHGRPLVNGYSGHTPTHFDLLSRALRRGDPSILTYFAGGRQLVVVVHRNQDPEGEWRRLVEAAGGVLQEESGIGPVFVIPPQPRAPTAPAGQEVRGTPFESIGGSAAIDLGEAQVLRGVAIALRWRHAEVGPKMTVEVSNDGTEWTPVWEDWIGAASLAAALEDQRLVPMRIPLPDVRARYVRVMPAPPWVSREMWGIAR